jgi:hypothetical protein
MRPRSRQLTLLPLPFRERGQGVRLLAVLLLTTSAALADPFADAVVAFNPAPGATFGQAYLPDNVLGPPEGGPTDFVPQENPQELVSLGHGGSITLGFVDNVILDGPGVDFLVFENVLINTVDGDPFIESATVEVSDDGATWHRFPFDFIPPDPPTPPSTIPKITEANFPFGFAGLTPTRSNSTNGVDATNPAVAGGDGFDLATVGLATARYVRITDCGLGTTTDGDGDVVVDDGDFAPLVTGPSQGFDLDAVAAVHSGEITAVGEWRVYR